jgi:hypothetical protein
MTEIAYDNRNEDEQEAFIQRLGLPGVSNDAGVQTIIFLVSVQRDLLIHQANKKGLPTMNLKRKCLLPFRSRFAHEFENLRDHQIQTIIHSLFEEEFDVNVYAETGIITDHFPLHNFQKRNLIWKYWLEFWWQTLRAFLGLNLNRESIRPLNSLSFYYGAKVGWYFAFYCHYTVWLLWIMIPGIGLAVYTYTVSDKNDDQKNLKTVLVAAYSIIIAAWSTLMLEVWKRHQNEIAFIWDMSGYQEYELPRIQYKVK